MNSSAPAPAPAPAPNSRNDMLLANETTAEEVSADEVAIIFSFLPHQDIMRARVCKAWRDAAKKTLVPPSNFVVDSVRSYNAMRVMATALPNLQQISLYHLGEGHKYSDGEDPDEERAAVTANYITHDINVISSFRNLRVLHINTKLRWEIHEAPLNGRYPVLFDFPLLRELSVTTSFYLKFDLGMLSAGCPSLKELNVIFTDNLTGDLSSLRVLKDTLEQVVIVNCREVEGDLMDLADFPRLKELNLRGTKVIGDIRDITEGDFPALDRLSLPRTVYGGVGYEFQSISDVPSFMQAIHLLLQRTPTLFREDLLLTAFCWCLSKDSPDWYAYHQIPYPPFNLKFIRAGSRLGWSWCSNDNHSCEINWLDPEPSRSSESSGYETYIEELRRLEQRINVYKGFHDPPSEMEYRRLCEEFERS
eukprot:scaffold2141_cov223-Skeletonema_dohrnii-CCMP3373.AAC.4